jgi:hypothetical protein
MFSKQCKAHLDEVGETGLEHMKQAFKVAVKLQLLVPVLVIHGVAPRFFTHTATDVMSKILEDRK